MTPTDPFRLPQGEQRVVFAAAADPETGGHIVVVGISADAWRYMLTGSAHTVDLSACGVPLKLLLFNGRDHASIMKTLEPFIDGRTKDLRHTSIDFSIRRGPPTKQEKN